MDIKKLQEIASQITTLNVKRNALKQEINAVNDKITALQNSPELKDLMPMLKSIKSVVKTSRVKTTKAGWLKKDGKFTIDNGRTWHAAPQEVSYKKACYAELKALTGLDYNTDTLSGAVKSLIEFLK